MSRFNINGLDKLFNTYKSIELESNWMKYIDRLADLIRKASYNNIVHILIYSSRKYVDIYELYLELEPYIENLENVSVFWETSIESLIYHLLLLDRVENGYLFIILPYDRNHSSQIEISYLYKLPMIVERVYRNGWRTIIINPVKSVHRRRSIYVAELTATISYMDREAVVLVRNDRRRLIASNILT